MTFLQLQKSNTSSPAVKLHQDYCRVSPKHLSSIQDWKTVLAGISYEQAESIIRWIQQGGLPQPPHAKTIAKNAIWYAELASRDPMAAVTHISTAALELAIRIANEGFAIEAEYVQDALNQYRDYFSKLSVDNLLYNHLPPARMFVEQWFTEIMPSGTARMRRFHLEHIKFKEFIRLTARAARRG